jgi:hypothetical protein
MAAATGLPIDIPIIIRSLSRHFYRTAPRHGNSSIALDRNFLLSMDAGIIPAGSDEASSERFVEKFLFEWWNKRGNDVIVNDEMLSMNNIDKCLSFHRHQINLLRTETKPGSYHFPVKPCYIWKPDAAEPITRSDCCKRCRLYRAVAMGTLDDHRDIRNLVQAMEISYATERQQTLRRAAGYNQLFEYLTIKEQNPIASTTTGPENLPIPLPSSSQSQLRPLVTSRKGKKGKKIADRRAASEASRQDAISDLTRIKNIPCLKWTWGASMSASDLPDFRRLMEMGDKQSHSGYNTALPFGSDTRSSSVIASENDDFEDGYFSDVSREARRPVPDLKAKNIPSCIFMHLRKESSRYLVSLYDDPITPMDEIVEQGPATGPFHVPLPHVTHPQDSPSHVDNC